VLLHLRGGSSRLRAADHLHRPAGRAVRPLPANPRRSGVVRVT